jgi:hypothetical protein
MCWASNQREIMLLDNATMEDFQNQKWENAHGVVGGQAALVRRNISLADVPRNSHPYTLFVSLLYGSRNEDGFPSDEDELSRLDRTEEVIAEKFWAQHQALFGLTITSDGTRDLFLFLPRSIDEDVADALIQELDPEVDYDFQILKDPRWEPYDILPDDGAD